MKKKEQANIESAAKNCNSKNGKPDPFFLSSSSSISLPIIDLVNDTYYHVMK